MAFNVREVPAKIPEWLNNAHGSLSCLVVVSSRMCSVCIAYFTNVKHKIISENYPSRFQSLLFQKRNIWWPSWWIEQRKIWLKQTSKYNKLYGYTATIHIPTSPTKPMARPAANKHAPAAQSISKPSKWLGQSRRAYRFYRCQPKWEPHGIRNPNELGHDRARCLITWQCGLIWYNIITILLRENHIFQMMTYGKAARIVTAISLKTCVLHDSMQRWYM